MAINKSGYYEVDVDNGKAYLFENELHQRNIEFYTQDRIAGAFADSFITFHIKKTYKNEVDNIVSAIYNQAKTPVKKMGRFLKVINLVGSIFLLFCFIALNYLFIKFAIHYDGGEIWISVVIALGLSIWGVYLTFLKYLN